jgi:hypothetical protein
MRYLCTRVVVSCLAFAAGCGTPPESKAVKAAPILWPNVEYDNAGLERVRLHETNLECVWHTVKVEPVLRGDAMQSYERCEFRAKLTEEQMAAVRSWLVDQRVFELTDPVHDLTKPARRSGFKSHLIVERPERRLAIQWTEDDTFPLKDPRTVGTALVQLCKRFKAQAETKDTAERSR